MHSTNSSVSSGRLRGAATAGGADRSPGTASGAASAAASSAASVGGLRAPGSLLWERSGGEPAVTAGGLARAIHSFKAFAKAHIRRLAHFHQVSCVRLSPGLKAASHVLIVTVYNEAHRLDAFLDHYRSLGFDEFIVVDNRSTDHVRTLLEDRPGVSYFYADGEYRRARFGIDWINGLLSKYCHRKWILHVDADEFLVFPHSDAKSIRLLTDHFEHTGQQSMNMLMLDMYSERAVEQNVCPPGTHPLSVCRLYDDGGYHAGRDPCTRTTWIKGGVRGRIYFDDIRKGPALNKTALVHWRRHYAFLKSTHEVWPYRINAPAARAGGQVSGALLHFKFLADMNVRLNEESLRQQHTSEYGAYTSRPGTGASSPAFVGTSTARFETWRSLLRDRLIVSDGEWG